MEASLRGIFGSESDIYPQVLGRVSSRENRVWRDVGKAEAGIAVGTPAKLSQTPNPSSSSTTVLTVLSLFLGPVPKMKFTTAVTTLALAAVAYAASTYTVSGMRAWSGRSGPSSILTFFAR